MMNRRAAMVLFGLAASVAAFLPFNAAKAQDASILELGVAGPLGDQPLGPENAKVTVYEYSSLTCSHCGDYHKETYPELKKLYIDSGKIRYIRRELAFDQLGTGAAMLAHCSGKGKYETVANLLFALQDKWAFTSTPVDGLRAIMRQTGMSDAQFDACLKDQTIFDGVQNVTKRAKDVLNVNSTPTFFINGKRLVGARPLDDFKKALDAALAEAK